MNEQQSQNLWLKIDPLSTIRSKKLNTKGEKLETAKLRVFVSNISSLPCFSYFAAFTTQDKIFILFCNAR